MVECDFFRGCYLVSALATGAEMFVLDNSDDLATLGRPAALADRTLCVNEHVFANIQHPRKLLFRNCTAFDSLRGRPGLSFAAVVPEASGPDVRRVCRLPVGSPCGYRVTQVIRVPPLSRKFDSEPPAPN
jgi:hypothetical protein